MPFKDPQRRKEYQHKYQKKWYKQNRETRLQKVADRKRQIRQWFHDLKRGMKCSRCGFSGEHSPWAIEFHHREPVSKTELVSYLVSHGYSRERILEEVEKCDILCSNCHRTDHYNEHNADPTNSIWSRAGRGELDGSLTGPEAMRDKKKRRVGNSKKRRKGRDSSSIPGPNPSHEEE